MWQRRNYEREDILNYNITEVVVMKFNIINPFRKCQSEDYIMINYLIK